MVVLDTYSLFAGKDGAGKAADFAGNAQLAPAAYAKWRAAVWPLLATAGLVDTKADAFVPEAGFELLFNGHDLTGWGFRPTTDDDRASIARWSAKDPHMPPWPIVEKQVAFDGQAASPDGRFRAINGRLVVTSPPEGRRIQKLMTTADFAGDFTLKLEFRATPAADSGVFLRGRQVQCRDYALAGPYTELAAYKPQEWNEFVAEVKRTSARCTVNGAVIEEAFEVPATGPIGVEGDKGQMEYRRVRIRR